MNVLIELQYQVVFIGALAIDQQGDLHLRPRRRRRHSLRRRLLPPEKTLVAPPPRENGKLHEMPCHHKLEAYLEAYIEAAAIGADRKGPLFAQRMAGHASSRTTSLYDRRHDDISVGEVEHWDLSLGLEKSTRNVIIFLFDKRTNKAYRKPGSDRQASQILIS